MNRCPDCRNLFVQPFTCTTCGAQKLYDETVRSLHGRCETLEARLAEAEQLIDGRIRIALTAPFDGWKGELERNALDGIRDFFAAIDATRWRREFVAHQVVETESIDRAQRDFLTKKNRSFK